MANTRTEDVRVRTTPEVRERIAIVAQAYNRTVSNYIECAIIEKLERDEAFLQIMEKSGKIITNQ